MIYTHKIRCNLAQPIKKLTEIECFLKYKTVKVSIK